MGDETFEKGVVSQWLVTVGETVQEDADLLEMTTDKAAFNVPSPKTGTLLEQCVHEGQEVRVGDLLCVLDVSWETSGIPGTVASSHAGRNRNPEAL